jgi:hypothetical protein
MTLDASGNLLVGTTSNSGGYRQAVFAGNNANVVQFDSTAANGGGISLSQSGTVRGQIGLGANFIGGAATTDLCIATGSSGNLLFNAGGGGTERARIDSSGNLLVGTTSTGAYADGKITVDTSGTGAAFKTSTVGAAGTINWNSATSGDNQFVFFVTETSPTLRGNIAYNRAGGLVAYNVTSDYRAKDISGPVTNSGALIDSVPVYMGTMRGATQERPMFIAHETPTYAHMGQKDAVDADGNPVYQQMDASALIPVMWAEIQSLRQRLSAANL